MNYHSKDLSNLIETTFRAAEAKLREEHNRDLGESQSRARRTHNAAALLPSEADSHIRHIKALTVARAQAIAHAYTAFNQSSDEAGEKDLAKYYNTVLSARRRAFQEQSERVGRRNGLSVSQLPGLLRKLETDSHTALLEGRAILANQRAKFSNPQSASIQMTSGASPEGNRIAPPRSADRPKPDELVFETAFHTYVPAGRVLQGGAGIVFEVRDEGGRVLAVKRLDPSKVTREKLKRFENELAFCKSQSHRNVIKPLDEGFTVEDGKKLPFYVMHFYPKTLRNLMADGIPKEKILADFGQVLDGVEVAHLLRVWHRDLKPENILYDPDSDTFVVADFGIAHFEEEDIHTAVETKDGSRLANFQYAAPEQKARGKKVDRRADIFALGLILNEMFTHEILQGEGYRRIATVAPEFGYLDEIVASMAQQEANKRPDSIDAVKQLLPARGNEYITRQKLSALRNAVIPSSLAEDPLLDNPVRVVETDYRYGKLIFTLSQPVNPAWVRAFHTQVVTQFFSGLSPQDFSIRDATIEVRADERLAVHARDHLERYLQGATAGYRRSLDDARKKKEEGDRRALQNQIEEEERRQRILGVVKGNG